MWYKINTHNRIFLDIKKNGILAFETTWMDLASIMLIEIHQTEKDNTAWFHLFVGSKKKTKMNKKKQKQTHREQTNDHQRSARVYVYIHVHINACTYVYVCICVCTIDPYRQCILEGTSG